MPDEREFPEQFFFRELSRLSFIFKFMMFGRGELVLQKRNDVIKFFSVFFRGKSSQDSLEFNFSSSTTRNSISIMSQSSLERDVKRFSCRHVEFLKNFSPITFHSAGDAPSFH